jgi:hypothetical protein
LKKKKNETFKDERVFYPYTEQHYKNVKINDNWSIVVGFLGIILFYLLLYLKCSILIAGPTLVAFGGWFLILGKAGRDWKHDLIYIQDGILFWETQSYSRYGSGRGKYSFRDITGVEVGVKDFTVYGNIVFQAQETNITLHQLKMPLALENVEDLLQFLRSKIILEAAGKEALGLIKDRRAKDTGVTRREIWGVINQAMGYLVAKTAFIGVVGATVAGICFLRLMQNEMQLHLGLIFYIALVGTGGVVTFYLLFGLKDLTLDFVLKRVNRYPGYFSNLQMTPIKRRGLGAPLRQYQHYHYALFYHTAGIREDYYPVETGEVKNDPVDGRIFLVQDARLLDSIDKNQKMEVLYLRDTKIIVRVKVAE